MLQTGVDEERSDSYGDLGRRLKKIVESWGLYFKFSFPSSPK